MSRTVTSPLAGSMLNSLPMTDSSAGIVILPEKAASRTPLRGAVGVVDRRQDELSRGRTVDGVRRRRIMTVLGLEVVDELGARTTGLDQLARRQTGEGDVHALGLGQLLHARGTR